MYPYASAALIKGWIPVLPLAIGSKIKIAGEGFWGSYCFGKYKEKLSAGFLSIQTVSIIIPFSNRLFWDSKLTWNSRIYVKINSFKTLWFDPSSYSILPISFVKSMPNLSLFQNGKLYGWGRIYRMCLRFKITFFCLKYVRNKCLRI